MRSLLPFLILFALSNAATATDEKPLALDDRRTAKHEREAEDPLMTEIREAAGQVLGDRAGAERRLREAMAAPGFEALPARLRSGVLGLVGWLATMRGDAEGEALVVRATALDDDIGAVWLDLAQTLWHGDRHEDAARTLAQVAAHWPARLADVEWLVFGVVEDAPHDTAARRDVLEALAAMDYAPAYSGDASWLWFEVAHDRLARGDVDAARDAVTRVLAPAELVKLRADRRFDALVDRGARAFDIPRAARRRVDDLRARALLDPDVLETQSALASAMLTVGEAENVIALVDDVEAAYTAHADPGYRDDDQRVWMLNHRADALRRLGRGDEAAAVLESARRMEEDGAPNVSQVLNLGNLYCANGEPAKARALLADVGQMSDYGRMVKAWVEVCSSDGVGDDEGVAQALAWIRDHRDVSEGTFTDALLLTGRTDEAAATVVERLRDPHRRGDVLLDLQDFAEGPALPGERALRDAWRALKGRDDVRTALDAVGRRESYSIHSP